MKNTAARRITRHDYTLERTDNGAYMWEGEREYYAQQSTKYYRTAKDAIVGAREALAKADLTEGFDDLAALLED